MVSTTTSDFVRKLIGTDIEDRLPSEPLMRWLQDQCRDGCFFQSIYNFCLVQPEELDPKHVRVVDISRRGLKISIPCKMFDHERPDKPLEVEVEAWVDPVCMSVKRLL